MLELDARPAAGPYILTRELPRGVLGDRWLALHERAQTSHVVHCLNNDPAEPDSAGRLLAALAAVRDFEHPHVLKIEDSWVDNSGCVWVVTPFTGDQDGLVSLDALLRRRGGFLSLEEARRAMDQLMVSVLAAHERSLSHGEITMREILADRRGSLLIEHYGIARGASAAPAPASLADAKAAEVRSVLTIGYQLATGLRAEEPLIRVSRVILDVDPSWDDLFETGLGPVGFASAAHALSAIKGCRLTRTTPGGRVGFALRGFIMG
ncbi:MAG: hypothetical protein K2X32_15275 [Phycisphaerales bacterium]|nr:hypothetical protein [Phycisphaerales bacterium]